MALLTMMPVRLLAVLMLAGIGCARIPEPVVAPDAARVRAILADRLDTLVVRPSDVARHADPDGWRAMVRYLDSLRAIGWEETDWFREIERRVVVSDPDSLERAYRTGVREAARDLERGQFRIKRYGLPALVTADRGCTWWRADMVEEAILQREFATAVDWVAGDALSSYAPVAYAEGYNRVAEPVIAAYWGVGSVWGRTRDRVSLYIRREGAQHEADWKTRNGGRSRC